MSLSSGKLLLSALASLSLQSWGLQFVLYPHLSKESYKNCYVFRFFGFLLVVSKELQLAAPYIWNGKLEILITLICSFFSQHTLKRPHVKGRGTDKIV